MQTRRREMIMLGFGGLILIGFIWAILTYFTAATLTITTNNVSNTIIIDQKQPNGTTTPINLNQDGQSTVNVRVPSGTYVITVKSPAQSSAQIVTVGVGEHKSVTLNLVTATVSSYSEPVTSLGAGSIAASKDMVRFVDLNSADRPLYNIDAHNNLTKLDTNTVYSGVWWAGPSFGIGYGTDKKTNQYVFTKIQGDFATPIKVPFKVGNTSTYTVAPNATWYISDGHAIYRGNADGSYTKVYSSSNDIRLSTASNDAVLFSEKQPKSTREGTLVILHTNGDKYQNEGEAYSAAWSPSGKKLATTGDTSELFDDKLNKIGVLPVSNFISPAWLDDNTLLYAVGSNVWKYDIASGKAVISLSLDPVTGSVSQIVPSISKDYLYLNIQKGGDRPSVSFRLDRVPLQNQTRQDLPQQLSLLIPNTVENCSLSYVNFTGVTIYAQGAKNCVPVVQSYLTRYNVPAVGLSIRQAAN